MGQVKDSAINNAKALRDLQLFWLSSLVHDFAAPLQAARGYARLILEDGEGVLTGVQRNYLNTVLENLTKLVDLSGEFGEFPSLGTLELEQFDLRPLLDEAAAAAGRSEGHPSTRIVELEGYSPLPVIGDRSQLLKAVHDFLGATVESTGADTIEIVVSEEAEKVVLLFSSGSLQKILPGTTQPDISSACKALRLHGGRALMKTDAADGFLIRCELPLGSVIGMHT